MMKKRFLGVIALAISTALIFTACGSKNESAVNSGGDKKLRLILDWTPNTNHTGFYVAKEMGFYKDLGLDVEIKQPAEGSSLQLISAGKGDYAITYQEDLTFARTSDANLPVKAIGAIIQNNTSGFASPKEKGIKTVKDFENKTYGGFGGPAEPSIIKLAMEKNGSDFSKLKMVDVGAEDFFAATKKNLDFEWVFEGWTNAQAKLNNFPINYIPLKDIDPAFNYYTPIIATTEDTIENKKEVTKKFMEATAKGYYYAIANPEESAKILVKYAPEISEDLAIESQKFLANEYKADAEYWGLMKDSVWDNYTKFLLDNKLLEKDMKASEAYTNEFLPKENNFK